MVLSDTLRRSRFVVGYLILVFSAESSSASGFHNSLVIAEQGGASISLDEVDAMIMSLPPSLRAGYLSQPKRIQAALSAMLVDKQTAAMAGEMGLKDQFYDAKVKLASERFIASEVRASYVANIVKDMPTFDLPAEEYYRAHPEEFEAPVEVDLLHILIKYEGADIDKARQRAEAARVALGDHTRRDQDLVSEFSDASDQDGILKAVRPNQLTPELEAEAFRLTTVGQVSQVVQSTFGFHVVKLLGRKEGTKRQFADIRDELIEKLKKQYIEKKKAELDNSLRNNPMRADPALLQALRTRYKSAAEGALEDAPAPSGLLSPHEFFESE